jgi:hypothetical protein
VDCGIGWGSEVEPPRTHARTHEGTSTVTNPRSRRPLAFPSCSGRLYNRHGRLLPSDSSCKSATGPGGGGALARTGGGQCQKAFRSGSGERRQGPMPHGLGLAGFLAPAVALAPPR